MNRSHSRQSYPNGKLIPKEAVKNLRCEHNSEPRKFAKKFHNRKVRHNPITGYLYKNLIYKTAPK